ncbi:MAG: polysaccharide biosynthesis tyrosine autokinase [Bacteroidetes bacterium]|nr:MAG: polysaccharide biosynthesis tyrosine autokinase [Bacteroidota bacterium]
MNPFPSEYTPTGDAQGQGKFSPSDILFKYLAYLPLFLICIIGSVGTGILYLRYTTPKYLSGTQILIKSSPETQDNSNQGELLDVALFGSKQINISNELERLRSPKVVVRTVVKNNFHINYFNEGTIRTSNIYNQVPFRLQPIKIVDSNRTYRIRFTDLTPNGYTLMLNEEQQEIHRWTDELNINGSLFTIVPTTPPTNSGGVNIITWVHPKARANEILGQLMISPRGAETTILDLSVKNDNPLLGRAILEALVDEYNLYSIETKTQSAKNIIGFIRYRLDTLAQEIKMIETEVGSLRDPKTSLGITEQSTFYLNRFSETEQQLIEIDIKVAKIEQIEAYLNDKNNRNKKVPSTFGLEDATLTGSIGVYNALQTQRDKDGPNLQPDGALLQQLDVELEAARQSALESLKNYGLMLQRQKSDLLVRSGSSGAALAAIPEKQRRLIELERQQKVKENLYLYLLQKREESALTTANTEPSYEQLSDAGGSLSPIEPDEGKIRLFSILFGFMLPIGLIYLRDLLNDRVYTRDDIQKKTSIPIVGEIGHVDDARSLVVAHKSRSIIAEQFRIIRSNLNFAMLNKEFKTLLITSTVSGEGKSFISINMAAVLALNGKKVALLEFDLRRPRILTNLEIQKTGVGISNCLLGLAKPEDVYTPMKEFPDLHIYPSGIVPPNPAELVMSDTNRVFFDYLKANYDYIIIDSAPVGLVSDTFSLAPFVDASIYLVRHRFTYKRQVSFVDEIFAQGKLPNLFIAVNDLKMGARFGYYGYGYGYSKGYGYGNYTGYSSGYFSSGANGYYDVKPTRWQRFWQRFRRGKGKG